MKKHISILLVICLIVQSCLPVFAEESIRTLPTLPPIRDIVIPPIILPTPSPTPTIPTIRPGNTIITPEARVINPPEPYKTDLETIKGSISDINLAMDKKLFTLSLNASKYPGKPGAAVSPYPTNNMVFIDWNRSDKSWWFKWNQNLNVASKMVWQVSNMPYTAGTRDMENPLGLVANGIIDSGQREFNIDFSKFVVSSDKIKKNFITPDYVNMINAAVTGQGNSGISALSSSRMNALKNQLAKQAGSIKTNRINEIKKVFEQKNIKNISSLSGAITKITSLGGTSAKLVPEATMAAQKELLETIGFANTMYRYYVRVITFDKNGKPYGNPSNPIEVIYGDPSYDETVTSEDKQVLVKESSGNLGSFANLHLDWNSSKVFLKNTFQAPITEKENYAYSYFQVTTIYPEAKKLFALRPAGLVDTIFCENLHIDNFVKQCVSANIDFSKFAPPADKNNPVQYRYYVRAVHVYMDYDNPGNARLKFSPPMMVTYGTYDAKAVQDYYTINVDIGTPTIRFEEYVAPFFGYNPSNFVEVVKTPEEPFDFMQVGKIYALSSIQDWLDEKARNENAFIGLLKGFGMIFTGIADMINDVSALWEQIQKSVVGVMASIGIPESVGGFLVTAALTACGIPPSIPNFNDLENLGADYVSDMIVSQAGGLIPEEIADKVVNEVMAQAEASANKVLSDLPEDLSALEDCVKPDKTKVWRPATISIELYNPYKNQIPSGEFDLRIAEAGGDTITADSHQYFRPQRIKYPTLKPGQRLSMAFPLEENCGWSIDRGEKKFSFYNQGYTEIYGPNPSTEWGYMIIGHKKLGAYITDITPSIPEPAEFEKELGLVPGTFMVKFNYQNYVLGMTQDMNDIRVGWKAADEHFPGAIYVSPTGNDSWIGSREKPLKSIQKAVNEANKGDVIILLPGTYNTDGVVINKPYIKLYGSGSSTILKGSPVCSSVLSVTSYTKGFIAKDMTIDGGTQHGVSYNGSYGVRLENLKVQNSGGAGIKIVGGAADISNCEVANTGLKDNANGYGILLKNAMYSDIEGCNIHNVTADGVHISEYCALSTINNCTISQCGKNGVFLEESGIKVSNSFIHDTDYAGVIFSGTLDCNVSNCTLLDTGKKSWAPITLGISNKKTNYITMKPLQNYGDWPVMYYADNNIIVQQNTLNRTMVAVLHDGKSTALAYKDRPWIKDNIYYAKAGKVQFYDGRPYELTHPGTDNPMDAASYAGGLTQEWRNCVEPNGQDNSKELDPKIDAKGRSVLQDCFGKGVEYVKEVGFRLPLCCIPRFYKSSC